MSRRLTLAFVPVLLCPLLLTGCIDAIPDAQQARSYTDGVEGTSGEIRVLHALVVAGENADSGVVSMTIVNRGTEPERLVGLESDAGTVELAGPQEIGPNQALAFGAGTPATASIRGLDADPAEIVTLTLTFENADSLQLRTVVVPTEGEYESITPSPEPSPTPSGTVPASPTAEPSPEAS